MYLLWMKCRCAFWRRSTKDCLRKLFLIRTIVVPYLLTKTYLDVKITAAYSTWACSSYIGWNLPPYTRTLNPLKTCKHNCISRHPHRNYTDLCKSICNKLFVCFICSRLPTRKCTYMSACSILECKRNGHTSNVCAVLYTYSCVISGCGLPSSS